MLCARNATVNTPHWNRQWASKLINTNHTNCLEENSKGALVDNDRGARRMYFSCNSREVSLGNWYLNWSKRWEVITQANNLRREDDSMENAPRQRRVRVWGT